MLLVSVSRLSKEEIKRRRRRRTRNLGECRNERIFDDDSAKNRRSLGKVRREREKTSAVLKIRSKSSALFFCKSSCFYKVLDLGRKKRQSTTRVNSVRKARFYSRPLSPLLLPLRKNISKKKGVKTFESRLTLDDRVKSATPPFGKERQNARKERENFVPVVQRTT